MGWYNASTKTSFLFFRNLTKIFCLIFISYGAFAQSPAQIALSKIDSLSNLISEAENAGFEVTTEKMTLQTAWLFLDYANWDEANLATNINIYTHTLPLPANISNNYSATSLATLLPNFERTEIISIVENAIHNLNCLLNGEKLRKPAVAINWNEVTIQGNKIVQNGVPVFLHDFIFKPADTLLTKFYGDLGGAYFAPNHLNKTANGTIELKSWVKDILIESAANPSFGTPFLGQTNLPDYIINEYPDVLDLNNRYTKFDVDHPQAKQMHTALFKEVVPLLKDAKASELGYMLTNEPHWNTANGNWDVVTPSVYTKAKFADWLKEKHHNNIDSLKALWNSNPATFQEAVDNFIFPVPYSLQNQPEWYDWMTFNQKRITNWFTFLKDEIQKHDVAANVHIKVMPWQWVGNTRDHGINFEALTALSTVIGNDAGAHNSYMWGAAQAWETKYNLYWQELSMTYDFFSSVNPGAIIYNSEGHFINKNSSANLFLKPSYIKMVYWLAFLQGLDIIEEWVWTRNADGSIQNNREFWHAGTVTQQPQILHEITATVMDVNRFAKEVDALQNERKPIRIFYSETSAINSIDEQNTNTNNSRANYMEAIFELYESVYFDGLPLGFVTKNIINEQNQNSWDAIAITQTNYVTAGELTALQVYLDNGGTVIMDDESLKFDEYGRLHNQVLTNTNGNLIVVGSANSSALLKQAIDIFLNQNNIQPPAIVTETNPLGANVKGCINRSITIDGNRSIAMLINVSKEAVDINLSLNNGLSDFQVIDLLNSDVLCKSFTMQPEDVLLLELNNGQTCNEQCIPTIAHDDKEISGGSYQAANQILSTASITNGSMVDYFSNCIILDDNFKVEKGAAFFADVFTCN